jgi:hypothetical protein
LTTKRVETAIAAASSSGRIRPRDTLDPYHYVRLQPGENRTDYVIVGGADHKSGEADDAGIRFEASVNRPDDFLNELSKEERRSPK